MPFARTSFIVPLSLALAVPLFAKQTASPATQISSQALILLILFSESAPLLTYARVGISPEDFARRCSAFISFEELSSVNKDFPASNTDGIRDVV